MSLRTSEHPTASEQGTSRRIAYLLKMYPRFSETFILSELLELERQGADIRVYSLKKPDDGRFHADASRLRARVTYVPESVLLAPRAYYEAHRRCFRRRRRTYLRLLWGALARRRLGAVKRFLQAGYLAPLLEREGIQHVHAHFASSATSVALYLHRLSGIEYSFTAHAKDIYSDAVSTDVLERKLKPAAFAVTVSDYNQQYLAQLQGGHKVVRIYNGLDLQQFSPNGIAPCERPLVLAVGRLVEKKGFADLIRACALLQRDGVEFTCLIVGKGPLEANLRALIRQCGLDEHVELPGPRSREELLHLYPQASAFVAPCVVGSDGNRDGLPTVLIEAMALGVPVVATPVTGIPELVEHEHTGLLVPEANPERLAAAIRRTLEDREDARARAFRGRRLVECRFDLKKNVSELRELFQGASTR